MDTNQWEKVRQWEKNLKEQGLNCLVCQKIITPNAYKNHNYWLRKEGIYHKKCSKWTPFSKIAELDKEKKLTTWEELVKKYPCWKCDYNFTDEEIRKRNWQVEYSEENGVVFEIYCIRHIDCENCFCSKCRDVNIRYAGCMDCEVPLGNLVAVYYDANYHPKCLQKKEKYYNFHTHPKIEKVRIEGRKIIATLEEGREASITLDYLIRKYEKYNNFRGWLKDITPNQLKNCRINNYNGFRVEFEFDNEAELDITVFDFIEGSYLSKCGCCSPSNCD